MFELCMQISEVLMKRTPNRFFVCIGKKWISELCAAGASIEDLQVKK